VDDVDNRGVGFCPYLSLRSINDAWPLSLQPDQYGTLFSIWVKILKGYLEGLNNGGWFVKSLAILQVADLAAGFQVTRKNLRTTLDALRFPCFIGYISGWSCPQGVESIHILT